MLTAPKGKYHQLEKLSPHLVQNPTGILVQDMSEEIILLGRVSGVSWAVLDMIGRYQNVDACSDMLPEAGNWTK